MDRRGLGLSARATLGLLSIAIFHSMTISLRAQATGARIAGTVADGTGAVIAGAQVTIKNSANGSRRELVTNESGYCSAPNLSPGPYTVMVSAKGFKSEVHSGLALTVGADVEVNSTMVIGNASQNVLQFGLRAIRRKQTICA